MTSLNEPMLYLFIFNVVYVHAFNVMFEIFKNKFLKTPTLK